MFQLAVDSSNIGNIMWLLLPKPKPNPNLNPTFTLLHPFYIQWTTPPLQLHQQPHGDACEPSRHISSDKLPAAPLLPMRSSRREKSCSLAFASSSSLLSSQRQLAVDSLPTTALK
jgi:hypothetical protein